MVQSSLEVQSRCGVEGWKVTAKMGAECPLISRCSSPVVQSKMRAVESSNPAAT